MSMRAAASSKAGDGVRRRRDPALPSVPASPRPAPTPCSSRRACATAGTVDWHAFGPDLYRDGRAARIGRGNAQDLLEASWARCRGRVEDLVSADELNLLDDLVTGRRPLPCEGAGAVPFRRGRDRTSGGVVPAPIDLHPRDRILGPVTVRPLLATWDHVALAVVAAGSTGDVALPITEAEVWMDRFSAGALTAGCLDLLAAPAASLPVLLSVDDVGRGCAFGSIAKGASLSRAEAPTRSRVSSATGCLPATHHSTSTTSTSSTHRRRPPRPPRVQRWPLLTTPEAGGSGCGCRGRARCRVGRRTDAQGRTPSPAASAGPAGVLPSSPVSTPPQKADEPLARSRWGPST